MRERNHWWGWLKLVAAWAMLCDHLRFVWPQMIPLFWIGRIAFPIFGVIAAANFSVSQNRGKYILKLVVYGIVSEIPFQLLTGSVGNVLLLFAFTFSAVNPILNLKQSERRAAFSGISVIPAIGALFCVYGYAGAIPLSLWCFKWNVLLGLSVGPS